MEPANQQNIGVIMEKLNTMHSDISEIKKETKETNGKVAKNIQEIALMKSEHPSFIKRENLGSILWKYLLGFFTLTGVFSFLAVGWFQNEIKNIIEEENNKTIDLIGKEVLSELEEKYDLFQVID